MCPSRLSRVLQEVKIVKIQGWCGGWDLNPVELEMSPA
jgi:hypothetical protein